ncbi:MAG: fused MFS/spermidine synthase [Planctomycetota bacterium]|nr:fused MFS/spermidine synthase [Planctomycetota bacterium]
MSKSESKSNESAATATKGWYNPLYGIVLLSGAALMSLEMAGARLVEPHFGSTIYVWGSIIGVFMGALSLGYWLGGRIADRYPRIETLGVILLIAALLAMIIPPIAPYFCTWMNDAVTLDVRWRTLIACLVLFALPSICMGMTSPFSVKLAAQQVAGLGRVAGNLYAVSTLGSIIGTLLVSFILVEFIGTSAIVYGVGVLLALVAVYCFLQGSGVIRKAGLIVAIIGAVGGYFGSETPLTFPSPQDVLLDTKESAYHYITIINGRTQIYPYRDPARLMLFNNLIESGILLNSATMELPPSPAVTACGYVDLLSLGMIFTGQAPKDMLVLGCGGGVGPRIFKERFPGQIRSIDVIDIDPWVFELAEKWFDYPFSGDPVIKSHVDDGRLFVQQQPDRKWDYIVMDAYSSGGRIPKHLITEEFFTTIRSRLAPGGVMLINVISSYEKPQSGIDHSRLFRSVYKTIGKVYESDKDGGGSLYAFPRNRSGQGENIIMVATNPDIPRLDSLELDRRYRSIKTRLLSYVDLGGVIQRRLVRRPDVSDVPILTDDFCPTDSMVHK